jgi:hypothetical protein
MELHGVCDSLLIAAAENVNQRLRSHRLLAGHIGVGLHRLGNASNDEISSSSLPPQRH